MVDDARAASPIQRIDAVTVATADMVAAVAFYRAAGFALAYGGPDATFTSFHAGDGFLNLQLEQGEPRPVPRWGRVVLFVDDVDAQYRRCVAAGLVPSAAPTDGAWGERHFHLRDPDGHELSFARPLPGPQ